LSYTRNVWHWRAEVVRQLECTGSIQCEIF